MKDDVYLMNLSGQDVDVIEEALLTRRRELSKMRRTLDDANPAELEVIRVVDQDLQMGEDLLKRIQELVSAVVPAPLFPLKTQPG